MAAQLADLRPALGRLLLGAALLFAILVGLRVHGFSLPVWHELLGVGEQSGLLWGEPQAIRADDFAVHIPLLLAQSAHDPPFPTVNTNIGATCNAGWNGDFPTAW